jgi:hypothetical protein
MEFSWRNMYSVILFVVCEMCILFRSTGIHRRDFLLFFFFLEIRRKNGLMPTGNS